MNDTEYKQLKQKILDVNGLIAKLDPAIRGEVFGILKPYLSESEHDHGHPPKKDKGKKTTEQESSPEDVAGLIAAHPDGSPADNVVLITAHLYREYGTAPFTAAEIKQLGDSFGLTVPNRIDNTLKTSKRGGKKLFQQVGKEFKATVHGESVFKSEYHVTKGRKPRPVEEQS